MGENIQVAIIGAGITGLSTAFYLERLAEEKSIDLSCVLLEKDTRLGGVIQSEREDGLLLERGPEGWASYKPAARKLIEDLGLGDQVIGSRDDYRRTLVVRQGRLEALPDGMMFLAPVDPFSFWRSAPLSLTGKLRVSLEPFVPRSRGELSVRRFFERRLGSEFTERLVEPLISAIYGGDFDRLSAPSTLPELYRAEQRAGSLWRGLRRFAGLTRKISVLHTMRDGMSQLVEHLAEHLQRTAVHRGMVDLKLSATAGRFQLSNRAGSWVADHVVLATPAPAAADLLSPLIPSASEALRQIPYGSSTLAYLAYRKSEFHHPLNAFGFIVPSHEPHLVDACTWVNTKFDHRVSDGTVLMRCAIHGHGKGSALSDSELIEGCQNDVARLMGIDCRPYLTRVFQIRNAIPQLLLGHGERVQKAREALAVYPGLHLAGSFVGGVGVPDCILTGRTTAEAIIRAVADGITSQSESKTSRAVRAAGAA